MYRSGWGTKQGQEVILAVRLQRQTFDEILSLAVHSNFNTHVYPSQEVWKKAAAESTVRLQWDPDRNPKGEKVERRAIQLSLRGDVIAKYAREWILDIQDISACVAEQREYAISNTYDRLLTPREDVYPVNDAVVAARLGLLSSNPIAPM